MRTFQINEDIFLCIKIFFEIQTFCIFIYPVILNLTEQPQVLNNYFNIYQIHILEIFKNKLFQKTKLYILSNIKNWN